ncbi:hypothetical protein HMPREF1092_02956 [Clostridium thermobutyricum]|uniref:Tyr recombinase domain-containing protein n=1 Tax=Clostridium thermobutyricum TaxID=29372 RepID=N9W9W3_9CLOT|nr:site-specific integrase [Clostridium thermobutyricum]ENY99820.1 hypothetical protein HMPREF1092_02956 [Clostridium thermobutyricum]
MNRLKKQGYYVNSTMRLKKILMIMKEKRVYSDEVLKENKIFFEELKEKGFIEGEFTGSLWKIKQNNDGISRGRNLRWRKGETNDMKSFILEVCKNKIGVEQIAEYFNRIEKAIDESDFFENFEKFKSYYQNSDLNEKWKYKIFLGAYLRYLNNKDHSKYRELLEVRLRVPIKRVREIPDFKSILFFEYVFKQFLEKASYEARMEYFPLILWWQVTSVIPTRTSELIDIKKEYFYKKNGDFYLKIPTKKEFSYIKKIKKTLKLREFKITNNIGILIEEYLNNKNYKGNYLISKDINNKYGKFKIYTERFETYQLRKMLENFYENVVFRELKEEYKIKKMKLGDTRHLAIMNLILQEVDPYIVKEMCGHRDINAHLHYINHAKTYAESKILVLTDMFSIQKKNILGVEVENKRLKKMELMKTGIFKIGDYYCTRYGDNIKRFPEWCISECEECKYSIFAGENKEKGKYINKIENDIYLLKKYIGSELVKKLKEDGTVNEKYLCDVRCILQDIEKSIILEAKGNI